MKLGTEMDLAVEFGLGNEESVQLEKGKRTKSFKQFMKEN